MKRVVCAAGMFAVTVGLAGLVGAAPGVKEGQWSMTMVIKPEGMGGEMAEAMKEMESMSPEDRAMMQQMMGSMNMKMNMSAQGMTTTISQCITNDHPVPQRDQDKDCRETHAINGNTVHFEVVCADGTSSGDVTYENDSMNGHITSTQVERGQKTSATIDITGQYQGPCAPGVSQQIADKAKRGLPNQ